jgi:hypothetical protein
MREFHVFIRRERGRMGSAGRAQGAEYEEGRSTRGEALLQLDPVTRPSPEANSVDRRERFDELGLAA